MPSIELVTGTSTEVVSTRPVTRKCAACALQIEGGAEHVWLSHSVTMTTGESAPVVVIDDYVHVKRECRAAYWRMVFSDIVQPEL